MKVYILSLLLLIPHSVLADPAIVEDVTAKPGSAGWTISVTLRHADTGWEDYADAWRVELADGTVVATRELAHPHVTEQPFTRSKTGVALPDGTEEIHIRARTGPDGWAEDIFRLRLD